MAEEEDEDRGEENWLNTALSLTYFLGLVLPAYKNDALNNVDFRIVNTLPFC